MCLPPVYPYACALRSLLVHGSVFAQRHPGEPRFIPAWTQRVEKTHQPWNFPFVFSFPLVFRSPEAVQHAGQASAGLHLPSPRPSEEGAPLHHHPAQLLGAAVDHQDVQGRHRLPHDGNQSRNCSLIHWSVDRWSRCGTNIGSALCNLCDPRWVSDFFFFNILPSDQKTNVDELMWRRHSAASGPGAGVHSQAARLHLHQEGAELAGRPDARVEEEETGGRATRGATVSSKRGKKTNKQTSYKGVVERHLLLSLQEEHSIIAEEEGIVQVPLEGNMK